MSLPRKKPAPDIFDFALERLGLAPEDCIAIEDSDNGARSALAAGIKALVVTVNGYTADQDFGAAALVVDQLGEPGSPPTALSGDLDGNSVIDLALLDRLHRQIHAA